MPARNRISRFSFFSHSVEEIAQDFPGALGKFHRDVDVRSLRQS
jgi:hypothetical protein